MTRRLRIPTERQLRVIEDNGLHEALIAKHHDDVKRALAGFAHGVPDEALHLQIAISTLAELLRAQSGIRALVAEVIELGADAVSESELFEGLAGWIIDNQIGRGFDWDGTQGLRRLHG